MNALALAARKRKSRKNSQFDPNFYNEKHSKYPRQPKLEIRNL